MAKKKIETSEGATVEVTPTCKHQNQEDNNSVIKCLDCGETL